MVTVSFLKQLCDYYKTPMPEKLYIEHYDDVLRGYTTDQVMALAKDCIKNCERFPSVAGVCKVIEKCGYKAPKKSELKSEQSIPGYDGFCKWYHGLKNRYPNVLPFQRNAILDEHYYEFERINNMQSRPSNEVWGKFFQDEWFIQVDKRMEEQATKNEVSRQEFDTTIPPKGSLGYLLKRITGGISSQKSESF